MTTAPSPPQIRAYRLKARVMGQTSPPGLQHEVIAEVAGSSVADVGCGSGVSGYLLRAAWQFTGSWFHEGITRPERLVGIDWSQATIDDLLTHNPYDDVLLAGAAGVPLPDEAVDTALSIENVEHLLASEVPVALRELSRIACRKIVISTPSPWAVTNVPFLTKEREEARHDRHQMGYREFITLVGWLHKSSVTPEQMRAAGFHLAVNRLGAPAVTFGSIIYTADPRSVDITKLSAVKGIGMSAYPVDDGRDDWRRAYLEVVDDSLGMATPRRPPAARRVSAVGKAVRDAFRID